jgi:hypothetical protein
MVPLAASYDLGFVGEVGHTQSRRVALTNKLFTYLLAGVPAVMSEVEAHSAIAPNLGAASRLFPPGDAAALAAVIDSLLGDTTALAGAREAAWRLGQERYNWEEEQAKLLHLVHGVGIRPRETAPYLCRSC